MPQRKSTIKIMGASLLSIVALVIALGIGANRGVDYLAGVSEQMYRHPFAVSNALLEAEVGIIEIRQHLLEAIIATAPEGLEQAAADIDPHEGEVYKHLEIAKENFLGEPSRIGEIIRIFGEWKPVRAEILEIARAGRLEKARPMVMAGGKGGAHYALLTRQMSDLIEFARAKADEFSAEGQIARDREFAFLLIMVVAVILLTVMIFFVMTKKVNAVHGQLSDSESRLRLIMDGVPVGINYIDRDEKYQFVSQGFLAMVGRRARDVIGNTVKSVIPAKVYTNMGPNIKRALTGRKVQFEDTLITNDGREISVVVDYVPHRLPNGDVAGFFSMVQDVTERKRAEAERENMLHDVGERIKELQCMYGVAESIRRRTTLEEIFQDVAELIPSGWHYPLITRGKIVFDGAVYVSEPFEETEWKQSGTITVDGEIRGAIEVYYLVECPELDEGPFVKEERNLLNGMARSLSEAVGRKQAEETVRHSERRYRNLIDSAEISIWDEDYVAVLDALEGLRDDGVENLARHLGDNPGLVRRLAALIETKSVNLATLKLFDGASEKELIGVIDRAFTENSHQVFSDMLCAIWAGEDYFRAEMSTVTLAGKTVEILVSLPLPKNRSEAKSVPVSMFDVTERKNIEDQLRHAQKMEAVGHLTGGVAHDFNNLLSIIEGNLSLLEEALEDGRGLSREDELKFVGTALRAGRRGAELTHRLLAFSRKQALQPTALDVNKIVEGMDNMLKRTLGEDIDLAWHLEAGDWVAEIDASQLENAILNLAVNGRDAMPAGGRLTIETGKTTLDDAYAQLRPEVAAGDYVTVTVSDTGTGMDADILERVFEPFFTTKEVGKGTGLGLSMVYGFAKQSGGHVTIYSEPGDGTTITLYLPRIEAAPSELPDRVKDTRARGGDETILVVEDDENVRHVTTRILSGLGYTVFSAQDGITGLLALEDEGPFDLLLTDVVMPGGMTGPEVAAAALEKAPGLKVLYMSGYTENAVIHNGRLDKGVHLINKPFSRAQLDAEIRRQLDSRPARARPSAEPHSTATEPTSEERPPL